MSNPVTPQVDENELILLGSAVDAAMQESPVVPVISSTELLSMAREFSSTLRAARGLGSTSEVVLLFNFALEVQRAILDKMESAR